MWVGTCACTIAWSIQNGIMIGTGLSLVVLVYNVGSASVTPLSLMKVDTRSRAAVDEDEDDADDAERDESEADREERESLAPQGRRRRAPSTVYVSAPLFRGGLDADAALSELATTQGTVRVLRLGGPLVFPIVSATADRLKIAAGLKQGKDKPRPQRVDSRQLQMVSEGLIPD